MGVKKTIRALIKASLMLRKMIICYFIFSIFFTGHFQMNHARVTDEFCVKILLPDSEMRSRIPQVLRASAGQLPSIRYNEFRF